MTFILILVPLLASCLNPNSMNYQDNDMGIGFNFHKIDFTKLKWGMRKEDVSHLLEGH